MILFICLFLLRSMNMVYLHNLVFNASFWNNTFKTCFCKIMLSGNARKLHYMWTHWLRNAWATCTTVQACMVAREFKQTLWQLSAKLFVIQLVLHSCKRVHFSFELLHSRIIIWWLAHGPNVSCGCFKLLSKNLKFGWATNSTSPPLNS